MTSVDTTQEGIEAYKEEIEQAKAEGRGIPDTFTFNGARN